MKIGLIFPGQGSQYNGMGSDLYISSINAKEIFDKADDYLEMNFSSMIFEGTDSFFESVQNTQLSIFVVSVACFEAFRQSFPELKVNIAAGHSLGEYSALYAAGVIDLETGLNIVKMRGLLMQQATQSEATGMVAVIGENHNKIYEIIEKLEIPFLYPANVNSYNQIVYSGSKEGIEKLISANCEEIKIIPLNVKGGFHSQYMENVKTKMHSVLQNQQYHNFDFPVISNIDGLAYESSNTVAKRLEKQIVAPVQWIKTIEYMIKEKTDLYVEVGPGKVLTGLTKRIVKANNVQAIVKNVCDTESIQTFSIT